MMCPGIEKGYCRSIDGFEMEEHFNESWVSFYCQDCGQELRFEVGTENVKKTKDGSIVLYFNNQEYYMKKHDFIREKRKKKVKYEKFDNRG